MSVKSTILELKERGRFLCERGMRGIPLFKKTYRIRAGTTVDRNQLHVLGCEVGGGSSETLRKVWDRIGKLDRHQQTSLVNTEDLERYIHSSHSIPETC